MWATINILIFHFLLFFFLFPFFVHMIFLLLVLSVLLYLVSLVVCFLHGFCFFFVLNLYKSLIFPFAIVSRYSSKVEYNKYSMHDTMITFSIWSSSDEWVYMHIFVMYWSWVHHLLSHLVTSMNLFPVCSCTYTVSPAKIHCVSISLLRTRMTAVVNTSTMNTLRNRDEIDIAITNSVKIS